MTENNSDLARIRTLFALHRIPHSLQSDVLSDGSIAARFNIKTNRPVPLASDQSISQESLFAAFRKAILTGISVPISGEDGTKQIAAASFTDDGAGIVEVGDQRLRFDYVGLLSQDSDQRQQWLGRYLAKNSLAESAVRQLRAAAARAPLGDNEFLKLVMILQRSPQALKARIVEQLDKQQLDANDFLPEELQYWDNLTAPLAGSKSLAEFFTGELLSELDSRLSRNPQQAIWSASLLFCAPGLVPVVFLKDQDASIVLSMVVHLSTMPDHFALLGALEIAADWVQRDQRFVLAGEHILNRLFGDSSPLENSYVLYATAFTVAGARLSLHHEWRKRLSFWRRLNIAAQASLFVRAASEANIDSSALLSWAMANFGQAYYASICLDIFDEPRWRPDWIQTNFLKADAAGRIRAAIHSVPEKMRPASWQMHLTTLEEKLIQDHTFFLSTFPAIGESARGKQPTLADLGDISKHYSKLIDDPTGTNLIGLAPLIFTYGCPSEAVHAIHVALAKIRGAPRAAEDKDFQLMIAVTVYVAAQYRDGELAEKAADLCLAAAGSCQDIDAVRETIFRIIESVGADPDRDRSLDKMTKRLEVLALTLEPKMLAVLLPILKSLQRLNDRLIEGLARAIAAARLGLPKVAA
jgi:hypothetical protein